MAFIKLAWLFSLVALLSFQFLPLSCMLSNSLKVQKEVFYPVELVPQIDSVLEVGRGREWSLRPNPLVHCGRALGPLLVM